MVSIEKLIPRKKVHFIGIGGVGMSALAQLLLEQGFIVSGSDVKSSKITLRLSTLGATIFIGHSCDNLPDVDVVVYSSCITKENCEIVEANMKKIKIVHRAFLLKLLMQHQCGIAVTGTHGKTTTTSLISLLLKLNGNDPSFAIGADVDVLGGNACFGRGKYFVAEADESDGSFLELNPYYAVITNIDKEHLDFYKDLNEIIQTFKRFIGNIHEYGTLFCCGQDKNIRRALKDYRGKLITYGFNSRCQIRALNIQYQGMKSEFDCVYKGESCGKFTLNVPGEHNILNALACIALGIELGIDLQMIKNTLDSFHGADRRFQVKNSSRGIMIIDDYAHHPTEIIATLQAARGWKNKRVVGVFQPHRYSRTKFLKKEFGRCFAYADHVVITDIYAANETPIEGIAAKAIYEEIKQSGHKSVCFLPRDKLKEHLMETMKDGDMLMMLGAGDIGKLADELTLNLSKDIMSKAKEQDA